MIDQAEIHRKVVSGDVEERRDAVRQLRDNFEDLPDKNQAWENLRWLIWDGDGFVRQGATYALGSAFQYVPDKEGAWRDLHRLLTWDKGTCSITCGKPPLFQSAIPTS